MSVAGAKNFDQPPHDSNRTHLVFSTSGLLLGSRAPLVFWAKLSISRSNQAFEPRFRFLRFVYITERFKDLPPYKSANQQFLSHLESTDPSFQGGL